MDEDGIKYIADNAELESEGYKLSLNNAVISVLIPDGE